MDLSSLIGSVALLIICVVLPSALAMYFSAPRDADVGFR